MKIHSHTTVALVLGLLSVGPFAALAHHSEAAFDDSAMVTIEGKVTQVHWALPHTLYFMEAKRLGEKGEMEKWSLEAPYPPALQRLGWTESSIAVGDEITVTGHPARSGRPLMLVKRVTTASGEHLNADGH